MFHEDQTGLERGPLKNVYARLDHRLTVDGLTKFWFDCIDAEWFDQFADRDTPLPILEAPVAIVCITVAKDSEQHRVLRSGLWLRLLFGPGGEDLIADQYLGFQSAPVQQTVARISRATISRALMLNAKLNLDHHPRATGGQLDAVLSAPAQNARWAAALDVGQGAANAFIGDAGTPTVYYDFGGGIMGNEATFPSHLKRFCFSAKPPVILSHWDWDHWSSAARDDRVLDRPWIVPHQPINRPVHLQFAADLAARKNLLIWPAGMPSRTFGPLELEICTGTTRNDTGIAIWFTTSTNDLALLPGDARYGAIPSLPARRPHAVVVPHHGADCAKTKVPRPLGTKSDRIVISAGDGNHLQHPTAQCLTAHSDAGWGAEVRTGSCSSGPRGGVRIVGSPNSPGQSFPCQGVCCDLAVSKL